MQNLLLQPSTIPTALALLMLASIVARVRAKPWPRPKPRVGGDEDPQQATSRNGLAVAFGAMAVLVGLLAMMIDARWFGRDEYGIVFIPTSFLILGCSIAAIATLHMGRPGKTAFLATIEAVALVIAFGMMACSGWILTGLASGVG